MKILTVGDIHGRPDWLDMADMKILSTTPNLITDFDKYIFVGDYVDSYDITNVEIIHNLKQIIQFKLNYPEQVILLSGNHDVQYMMPQGDKYACSGFRPEGYYDLHDLFRKNIELFQLAYQYETHLWSHAGVHIGWYEYDFPYQGQNIAEDLNGAFREENPTIFQVSYSRGGWNRNPGPLWADKTETWEKPIKGYHQIIGHSRVKEIITHFPYKGDVDTSVTYVDCQDGKSENTYHILEI